LDDSALDRTVATLTRRLLEHRKPSGCWEGYLASSALSTATATVALILSDRKRGSSFGGLVRSGLEWLIANQNADGGWGDTTISLSNLSTTVLCWSALSVGAPYHETTDSIPRAERWLRSQAGELKPERLQATILGRYGQDKTFSVPILTVLALTGKLGSESSAWRLVPQLPFELSGFPHGWFQWLRLPVVSYALPALVAIGQVRHRRAPSRNPVFRLIRSALESTTLRKALEMQPASGGFLEAVPLTAFVAMSLIEAGSAGHAIVANGLRFLETSVRPDGSWPIDTNLSTWVTTLSVNALAAGSTVSKEDQRCSLQWLLDQQVRHEHPFTHARPGGWAWTDLSGGVPDADDTSGALLAIWNLAGPANVDAAVAGITWLLDLQNSDGGIPTFCKGWGALPFDRSAPDLTAHALEAWSAWFAAVEPGLRRRIASAAARALNYLERHQQTDGSWIPLWFGNQHAPDELNHTYGTAGVTAALNASLVCDLPAAKQARRRGVEWLLRVQNANGGWSGSAHGPSSIEETSLALSALATRERREPPADTILKAIDRGAAWLIEATDEGRRTPASAIGLYFARLWYYEELYPIVFALRALSRVRSLDVSNSWT
jgi:squalene-hopene/tetraprenyl-beta-curcumene cyclase